MKTDQDTFSSRLIQSRSMKGWSQLDLAKASEVAAAQVSRYEQGSNTPRPQVVARLANALGVSFPWLLSGIGDAVELRKIGKSLVHVELPNELIRRLHEAASQNRRLVDEEVQARLEATFDETVVTTVEARVRQGAEEKRFEFNADEIADKVVERLEGRSKPRAPNRMIIVGNLGSAPDYRSSYEHYANVVMRGGVVNRTITSSGEPLEKPRGNEPYGPKKSSNAPKALPKKKPA